MKLYARLRMATGNALTGLIWCQLKKFHFTGLPNIALKLSLYEVKAHVH